MCCANTIRILYKKYDFYAIVVDLIYQYDNFHGRFPLCAFFAVSIYLTNVTHTAVSCFYNTEGLLLDTRAQCWIYNLWDDKTVCMHGWYRQLWNRMSLHSSHMSTRGCVFATITWHPYTWAHLYWLILYAHKYYSVKYRSLGFELGIYA